MQRQKICQYTAVLHRAEKIKNRCSTIIHPWGKKIQAWSLNSFFVSAAGTLQKVSYVLAW
jgi:hypothetical protein